MTARGQLHCLTAARGIAAWAVVFYHMRASTPWLPSSVWTVMDKGYLAVDFFFLLSGFVIWLSAHEAFQTRGLSALPDFLKRRAARIYPLYAFMLALTAVFAAIVTLTGRDAANYPWTELPLHAAMLQNWGFTDALSWNHPAWSISTEFAAYLLFPVLALAVPVARAPGWVLGLSIMLIIGAMAATLGAMGYDNLGADIPHTGLTRCLCEFTAGALLCALWLRNEGGSAAPSSLIAMCIGAGAALTWHGDGAYEPMAFPTIAAALIFLLASASAGLAAHPLPTAIRPFVYLGDISYATYLSHFMLFIWFKILLVDDTGYISPAQASAFLLVVLAASILLHHGIEKPGRSLVRKRRAGPVQVQTA